MKNIILVLLIIAACLLTYIQVYCQGSDSLAKSIRYQKVSYLPTYEYFDFTVQHAQPSFSYQYIFKKYIKGSRSLKNIRKEDSLGYTNDFLIQLKDGSARVLNMTTYKNERHVTIDYYLPCDLKEFLMGELLYKASAHYYDSLNYDRAKKYAISKMTRRDLDYLSGFRVDTVGVR